MDRAGEFRQRIGVMHLTVGHQDRPGDPVGRDFRRRLGQCTDEPGPVLSPVAHPDLAQLQPTGLHQPVKPRPEPFERLRDLVGPEPDPVRGALVDHHQRDVGHRQPVLLPPGRLRQRHQQHQRRERAQPPAGQPPPERQQERREA